MTLTNAQRLTLVVTLVITLAILLWDYVLMKDGVPGNTISSALKSASECLPIPILFGIWMAHSWWYLPAPETYRVWRMVGFAVVVVGSYLWWEGSTDRVRLWFSARPQFTFLLGFLAGHWVWPQYTGSIGS